MKTYAPSFTNCFAVARPMPLLPPVTRAVFPSSLPMFSSLVVIRLLATPRATQSGHPPLLAGSALGIHSDDQLAEIASFQHADKGFGGLLQTVDDIFAVADAAVDDACTDLVEEFRVVLFAKFGVDVAPQRQALGENLAHG